MVKKSNKWKKEEKVKKLKRGINLRLKKGVKLGLKEKR